MAEETKKDKELHGEITSNNVEPETKAPTLAEKVETVEISTLTPDKTEYTK